MASPSATLNAQPWVSMKTRADSIMVFVRMLPRAKDIHQDRQVYQVFFPAGSLFAGDNPLKLQDTNDIGADFQRDRMLIFFIETAQAGHMHNDVDLIQAFASEHGGIFDLRRDIGNMGFANRIFQVWVVKLLEPQINILGDDRSTLQGCRGQPNDHEGHPVSRQQSQEGDLRVC